MHRPELVARVKGAAKAGLTVKTIAWFFGLPPDTIREWLSGDRMSHVEADPQVADDIREALLGRFMGRESAR